MLDGINVLNTTTNMNINVGEFIIAIACITLFILSTIRYFENKKHCDNMWENPFTYFSILLLIVTILFFLMSISHGDIKEYQVTIDESVSMVEFNEKYDVIKVDGKIWTIRERDGE